MADDVNNQDPTNNGSTDNGTSNTQTTNTPPSTEPTEQELEQKRIQDALMLAVQNGDRVRLDQLIAQGAGDVNKVNADGTTPIGDAIAGNDKNISRDFLQQKANGNTGYDPALDPSLTGLTTPGTTPAAGVTDVAAAMGMGLTAAELAATGNYALAAQLDAQQDFAQEALEANDTGSTDLTDGDWSYAASVADMDGWDDEGDDYDDFGDDYYDDGFDDGFDDYGDDGYGYDDGYDDYYGDSYADDSAYGSSYGNTGTGSTFGFGADSTFGLGTDSTLANGYDPTATGLSTTTPGSTSKSGFMSSFLTGATDLMALDVAATGLNSGMGLTAVNTALNPATTATSSFFDMSAPLTGTSVWNTSFFDPGSIGTGSGTQANNNNTLALNTTPAIAPTNPYYKPSAAGSTMAM